MELTIDTSSNTAGVVLSHRGAMLASLTWQTASNHTTELLPNVVCVLQRSKVDLRSLEAIIVARGPGSFNGLRVGLSTAKGLAYALSVPILGVNALEAEAYPFAFTGLPLRPLQRAGRDEIVTALYRQEHGQWRCLEETNLTTVGALCRRTRQRTLFCGEIPSDMMTELQQVLGARAPVSPNGSLFRGVALTALGWHRLSAGERDNPVTLQPLYLRPPHITTPREKKPPFVTPGEAQEIER